MPPAVIYFESDYQVQQYHQRDDWFSPGENWDEELVEPGRMVYMGQGQMMFLRIDEVEPGLIYPKRRKKKKKKASTTSPSPPAPAPPSPAPIDWGDWEELCQAAPPVPPPPPLAAAAPWEAEIAASQWEPEDWEAEIAASQWEPLDWESEITAPWQPEDWEAELSQWQPEDWEAELSQ
jgi:hypothetical protein